MGPTERDSGTGVRPHEGGDPAHGGRGPGHDRETVPRQRRPEPGRGGADGRARTTRRAPLARRVLRWSAIVLCVLILGTAGAGYLWYDSLNDNLRKAALHLGDDKLDPVEPNAAGQTPLNILLLGSDSRNSDENVRLGGARADRGRPPLADVQMLLHLSADRGDMSVLSIPRDTRVTIPRCTDPEDGTVYQERVDRINASLQNGGPGCTVATWERLTGIPVDHFMMIDFAGVVSMADAVGGVPVCVDANVYDRRSGLRLEQGETTIRGEQALQWLRTRYGFEDGSDIGRARAQHMYMSSMVRQLKSGTKLSNPNRLRRLAEEATSALTVDHGLDRVEKLFDLANELKKVPSERITMATMPWVYSPGGSYVLPKEGEAEQVFSMLRRDVALDGEDGGKPAQAADPTGPESPSEEPSTEATEPAVDPSSVPVRVFNGTGGVGHASVSGRAAAVTGELRSAGFAQAVADATPRSRQDTVLTYAEPGQRAAALTVAKALGLPEDAVRHSPVDPGLALTVGADWPEGTTYPGARDPANPSPRQEDDNRPPPELDGINGEDETACMHVNPAATW
ncbi:LCP family protein [Streptomyces sp. JJ38]|uniref:LCP family protein n=1 Tax=Streptomyces sp. JJ38 TaxID=2738128 RepID=UPI001C576852|nr:LCP family protein [Streptomyces sp. JJ38]MBW1595700.1 LCP family protein [Streptomyces sp. JJ38]